MNFLNYQMTNQLLIKLLVTAHRLFRNKGLMERCTLLVDLHGSCVQPTDLLLGDHCLVDEVLQLLVGKVDTQLLKAVHSEVLWENAGAVASHPTSQSDCSVVFKVFRSQSTQDTNLKPVDVHYTHGAVHLCGTEPVIDLLQQPVKQHRIQGFGDGISAKYVTVRRVVCAPLKLKVKGIQICMWKGASTKHDGWTDLLALGLFCFEGRICYLHIQPHLHLMTPSYLDSMALSTDRGQ